MTTARRQLRGILSGLCVLLLLAGPARAQEKSAAPSLVFGLISPRAAAQTRANWAPFAQRLGLASRRSVDLRVYESQAELSQAFIAGEIDLAWMGNAPALDVVEAGAGAVFAQMVTEDGSFGYKSLLITQRQASFTSLSQVLERARSLSFSDGDPKSTSGYLVPLYYAFQKNGVDNTKAIFKSVETGSHQQNIAKVAKGEVDVATANNEELAFFKRDFPALAENVKVVWESPLIPQSPLLWKASLAAETKKSIKTFVMNFGATNAEEKKILLAVNGLSRFRPSTNRQLVPVADLEMFKTRRSINNDKSLSDAERLRKINEAIERGSRLELRLKLSS